MNLTVNKKITIYSIAFLLLALLDSLMSIYAVNAGLTQELNPLYHIFDNYFWIMKALGVLFVVWLAHRYSHVKGIATCTIFMGIVIVWNMFNIISSLLFLG